jgi:YbgC/YbaW family acyl-CoA thioester hydrolase
LKYCRKVFGYECDIYGHLNNANYLHLYEEARSEVLESSSLPIKKLMVEGYHIYVVKIEIDFIKPVMLGETVTIMSVVESMNRLKGIWKQEILSEDNEICSRAQVTGVFIKNGKPVRLPKDLYSQLIR